MVSVKHMNIAVATEQQANDMDPHTVAPPRPRAPSLSPPVDAIAAVWERGGDGEGVHAGTFVHNVCL